MSLGPSSLQHQLLEHSAAHSYILGLSCILTLVDRHKNGHTAVVVVEVVALSVSWEEDRLGTQGIQFDTSGHGCAP